MKKEELKIVFLGTPEFAVASLDRIYNEGYNIVGVVTMPDKPAGRGHKMYQSDVKKYALEKGLHLMQPVSLKDPEFIEHLRSLQADLFVVIAFRMLPRQVWQMPPLGTFNLHASLLPRYRGAAPINRAVMNGDTHTGVTTFFLKHELDTGDIIDRVAIEIGPDENVGSVHDRLMELGAELTLKTIESIVDGTLKTIPQDSMPDAAEACDAPKIFKETCRIDWNSPTATIHNHVRGLSPYPAAWTVLTADNAAPREVKVYATVRGTDLEMPADAAPGHIHVTEDLRMAVRTADGVIEITRIQPAGKKQMPVSDFLRGARLVNPQFTA
ncbi:MAG: methionyl-tRNA formyltransferase [Muribaculaceae bacterium]|nr:methionyl-tRNA formyltransferase [Muribaculaceae bacterium]